MGMDAKVRAAIMETPNGSYQSDLLMGWENWSGSSLKGKAASFGGKYAQSRNQLLERIKAVPGVQGTSMSQVFDDVSRRWQTELLIKVGGLWWHWGKDVVVERLEVDSGRFRFQGQKLTKKWQPPPPQPPPPAKVSAGYGDWPLGKDS